MMNWDFLKRFVHKHTFGQESDQLVLERFFVTQQQMPMMYSIVIVNMVVLSFSTFSQLPLVLSTIVPTIFFFAGAARIKFWVQIGNQQVDIAEVRRILKNTLILTVVLAFSICIWACFIVSYSDVNAKYYTIIFISFTIVSCIFCLISIPKASLLLLIFGALPMTLFLIIYEGRHYVEISLNVILVIGVLILVVFNRDKNFIRGVVSHQSLKFANMEMTKLANSDDLTQSPNRRCFFQHKYLSGLPLPKASPESGYLFLINIDNFRSVNELFGQPFGDKVLVTTAKRIAHCCAGRATYARLGADEFGVLYLGGDKQDAYALALDLQRAIRAPIDVFESTSNVDVTIAIAGCPDHADNGAELHELAGYTLSYAKKHHRGQINFHKQKHADAELFTSKITKALTNVAFESELSVLFQPIWNHNENYLIGFETLVRWNSPDIGNVSPSDFIPIAEANGMISKVTRVVVEKAIQAATLWPDGVKVGLNVSAAELSNNDVVGMILETCRRYQFDHTRVVIEVTETAVMKNFNRAKACLDLFREHGLSIAMDDFGSGNSSLGYLQQIPLDHVKLDKSFVNSIVHDPKGKLIASMVRQICQSLGLGCVAEGVETIEQLQTLKDIGYGNFQGYLFSKPITGEQTVKYIETECAQSDEQVGDLAQSTA